MSSFARKIDRNHARAAILAQARAHGCTCQPDIVLPKLERGKVRAAMVAHDNDCPHAKDRDLDRAMVRLNAGELDAA